LEKEILKDDGKENRIIDEESCFRQAATQFLKEIWSSNE